MGMFDYVRVDYPVPDINPHILRLTEWQTKDLENMLNTYTVNECGELYLQGHKEEFTGVIEIYGYKGSVYNDADWFTFYIEFQQGNLVQISNQPIRLQEEGAR